MNDKILGFIFIVYNLIKIFILVKVITKLLILFWE